MSVEREGFTPDKGDQESLLTRALSNFVPRENSSPPADETKAAEDGVRKEDNDKERKLSRGKVSSDDSLRRKERYKIKPREIDDADGEDESLDVVGESEEEFEDEEFEDAESEDDSDYYESEDEEESSDLDLSNPTVRLLVEQNQRLMKMVEAREQEGAEQKQEDSALALGDVSDLFTKENIVDAQEDPEKFVELLTKVVEHLGTRILQAVPQLVNKSYSRKSSLDRTVEGFFSKNPQLHDHRGLVGYLSQAVSQEQPNASTAEVLVEAGRRAYKELGLKPKRKKKVVSGRKEKGLKKGERRQNAAFARTPRGKSGTQPKRDSRNKDQQLIDRIVSTAQLDNR